MLIGIISATNIATTYLLIVDVIVIVTAFAVAVDCTIASIAAWGWNPMGLGL